MTRPVELERVCQWFSRAGSPADAWILVRSQALQFWAGYFGVVDAARVAVAPAELSLFAPLQSAQHFATCLGGALSTADDGRSENVILRDGDDTLVVRFFARLSGVPPHRIRTSCIELASCTRETGVHVMHPVHLLGDLVHELARGPRAETEPDLSQLHTAIDCAHAFIRRTIDAGRVRDALRLNEAVHAYAVSPAGLAMTARHDLPIINALALDERLPAAFHERDYPLMLRVLGERLRTCALPQPKRYAPSRARTDGETYTVESMLLSEGQLWLILRSEAGLRIEHPVSRANAIRHGDTVRLLASGGVHVIARATGAGRQPG